MDEPSSAARAVDHTAAPRMSFDSEMNVSYLFIYF
jgi:hypothetical protein